MSAGSVAPGWPEALARPAAGMSGSESPEGPGDGPELQLKVDFFRKLGYSSEEIRVVLQKLGLGADTNTVLGELVKHGPAERDGPEAPPEPGEAPLVPRGGAGNKSPAPGPEETESDNLKPIVIDGSNVAMRCVRGGRGAVLGELCRAHGARARKAESKHGNPWVLLMFSEVPPHHCSAHPGPPVTGR